jgi:hypothetical protein
MSKSDVFENDLLKLIFNATPIAGLADNAASAPVATLYLALHTADPGEAGNQSTSEISYTGYARAGIARTAGAFTVTNNSVSPVANTSWPASTGGTGGTATHWSIGTLATGTGKILYSGPLTPNITVVSGVQPVYSNASTVTED